MGKSRNKIFWIDNSKSYSYLDLIKNINKSMKFKLYCKESDSFAVFLNIILSIINDKEVILLDSDFSDEEMQNIIGDNIDTSIRLNNNINSIQSYNDLISAIKKVQNWKITLFTSGTTGLPKKVVHSFQSLTRAVQIKDNHYDDIWGFAYNPTHIAGLQVFFQALLNQNTMVNLFKKGSGEIEQLLNRYKISHLSATPTFYRMLLNKTTFSEVKRITSGGEKLDNNTELKVKRIFPNAKLRNVYASTEAGTIFSAKGDVFEILPVMEKFVRIENDEILIHSSMMGVSQNGSDWYHTGDLIEMISENPLKFRFKSRKNEMINVGGMKVNPNEVEDVIKELDGINDVLVYGKENSLLGNILCADIIGTIEEKQVKLSLREKLQNFKIPRIINFVDEIPITRTGKKKR